MHPIALGKIGAVIGSFSFNPIAQASSYPTVMGLCVIVSFLAIILSHIYVDEKRCNETTKAALQEYRLRILRKLGIETAESKENDEKSIDMRSMNPSISILA